MGKILDIITFGDCRDTMRRWAADGVRAQTCVTSPPYFGLRDYGHPGQIGLEKTPEEYIAAMVEVFRCVKDVLADDGTLWLNIGDSYVGAMSQHKDSGSFGETSCISKKTKSGIPQTGRVERNRLLRENGLKQKDLIGIPWLLAFALRADGWYLRQDSQEEIAMPLVKSPSKAAFRKNVAAEVKAGKPVKQAVAIAYSTKRQAAKKK